MSEVRHVRDTGTVRRRFRWHGFGGHRSLTRAALAVAAALTIALTACQVIPTSGEVQAGLPDLQQSEQQVLFSPAKPAPGASKEEIVRGFVFAASSSTDDYAIAREFLTEEYASQWDPSVGVLIDDDTRSYRTDREDVSILQLSAVATVDANGVLTPLTSASPTEVRFELREEDGEWRIFSAPAGVILDRTTFMAVWSPHQLFFGSSDGVLVPDPRWFLTRATMSTQIVDGLLAGPAPALEGTAVNGFPSGTVLTTEAVPVVNGVAEIDLSNEFELASPSAVDLVVDQLRASLNSVPGVTQFSLTVGPREIVTEPVMSVPGINSPVQSETSFSPAAMRGQEFGFIGSNDFIPDSQFTTQLEGLNPETITMTTDQRALVAQTAAGAFWVTPDAIAQVDGRSGLMQPTLDRYGVVWTALRASGSLVSVTRPSRDTRTFSIPWLEGEDVVALRVSPEGHRLAAMTTDRGGTRIIVGGIVRNETGVPVDVSSEGAVVFWATGTPVDMDWVDDYRIVAVSRTPTQTKVTLGGPGVFATDVGAVQGAVSVRGGGSRAAIRLLDDDGVVYGLQGSGWQRQVSDISLLAKRG